MEYISYKKGYKYQLVENYSTEIPIKPDDDIESDFIILSNKGQITIKKGYAWDGPSGPTIDTSNFMRGSLIHDAIYQLMREGGLDNKKHREPADKLLQQICKDDGMAPMRAWWVYIGLRFGGSPAADPENIRPVVMAPKSGESIIA
ncbi:MAG: DUF1353 domain-containing protein [Fidelibacterota bacterium]